jgi:hypothetical protein
VSGVNIFEPSETLFRKQLAAFLGGIGTGSAATGFTSLKLLPITTTQKNALPNVKGTVVYDGTLNKLCQNTGAGWETVTSV